ncbi:UNVERIFIED_CONTAM: hypothetical protein HDU68_012835 [Siphonaria sp. JEL0065]|nr:hypothetical protein HDU68_012835 [Siphonaria sp. JEL0065]
MLTAAATDNNYSDNQIKGAPTKGAFTTMVPTSDSVSPYEFLADVAATHLLCTPNLTNASAISNNIKSITCLEETDELMEIMNGAVLLGSAFDKPSQLSMSKSMPSKTTPGRARLASVPRPVEQHLDFWETTQAIQELLLYPFDNTASTYDIGLSSAPFASFHRHQFYV